MLFAFNTAMNNLAELSLADKGISSAKVILTGFVVVFSMLVLLIFIIKIYSFIVGKAQNTGLKTKKKQAVPEKQKAKTVPAVPESAPEPEGADGVPGEVIAVIAAAVDAMYSGKEKVRIKSVKKSRSRRTAWADAGVLENTRPF